MHSQSPLKVNDTFETTLGPRRTLYVGDQSYFQYQQRRYYCVVIPWVDTLYRDTFQRSRIHRELFLKILSV